MFTSLRPIFQWPWLTHKSLLSPQILSGMWQPFQCNLAVHGHIYYISMHVWKQAAPSTFNVGISILIDQELTVFLLTLYQARSDWFSVLLPWRKNQ